jgi:hypothetical protein
MLFQGFQLKPIKPALEYRCCFLHKLSVTHSPWSFWMFLKNRLDWAGVFPVYSSDGVSMHPSEISNDLVGTAASRTTKRHWNQWLRSIRIETWLDWCRVCKCNMKIFSIRCTSKAFSAWSWVKQKGIRFNGAPAKKEKWDDQGNCEDVQISQWPAMHKKHFPQCNGDPQLGFTEKYAWLKKMTGVKTQMRMTLTAFFVTKLTPNDSLLQTVPQNKPSW